MKLEKQLTDFRRGLRQLEREISQGLSLETDCCGITVAQCHLLLETEFRKCANLGELATALELDKSTLSRTVDGLCIHGLIDRKDDTENRRKVSIQLTAKGKEKVATINSLCNQTYRSVFTHIPEDKHASVIEAVALLAEAMRKTRKDTTCSC